MLRKIVSFIIVLPLLIIPLFCCCNQEAEAAVVGGEYYHNNEDSHSAKHNDSKSDHDHNCNCGHALNAIFENLTTSKLSLLFAHNFFPETTFAQSLSVVLFKANIYFAYLGPPGRPSEVPLYIQQHSLRI